MFFFVSLCLCVFVSLWLYRTMNEQWRKIKETFQHAVELTASEREVYLNEACGDDSFVRQEVEALLSSDEQAGDFIASSIVAAASLSKTDQSIEHLAGRCIGPYKIVRELGRGGMGMVLLAERADSQYSKQVAIKLVRMGMDSEFTARRFRTERQILASLDHPNIAKMYDGGVTEDGRPYFVMEYIEGELIDSYCDSNGLDTRARLKLFRQVCGAIQHAHQRLIIHRDIKPSNVLVTREGVPKLLDFGIAKLLDPTLTGEPLEATATAMRLMTPEYASPEQVRGERITAASDVYSLGVLLYKLLTGALPYKFKNHLPHEVLRVVCEEEPARPKLSDSRLSEDLENILLMALRKEPERRYGSAERLMEDIRRALENLPVLARKDTLLYRGKKFLRRNRISVAAAALVLVSLSAGLVAALWQARVAGAERERAEQRFNDVRKLANSYIFEIHAGIRDLPVRPRPEGFWLSGHWNTSTSWPESRIKIHRCSENWLLPTGRSGIYRALHTSLTSAIQPGPWRVTGSLWRYWKDLQQSSPKIPGSNATWLFHSNGGLRFRPGQKRRRVLAEQKRSVNPLLPSTPRVLKT
jgi:eukaryotic-like serine/threonine-protein kinase